MRWKTRLPIRTVHCQCHNMTGWLVMTCFNHIEDSGVAQRCEDVSKNPTAEIMQNQARLGQCSSGLVTCSEVCYC